MTPARRKRQSIDNGTAIINTDTLQFFVGMDFVQFFNCQLNKRRQLKTKIRWFFFFFLH